MDLVTDVRINGYYGAIRLIGQKVVVPRRAGTLVPRQESRVRVQHHVVLLVGYRAQNLALGVARILEQGQRLIGVRGQDDMIERFGLPLGRSQRDPLCVSANAPNGSAQADPLAEGADDTLDVAVRAALDDVPLMMLVHAEQSVVVEEAEEEAGRELEQLRRAGGPDCRPHGNDVALDERAREATVR